jgi:RNA polymerase sigma-70 factor (ECF subfamily)
MNAARTGAQCVTEVGWETEQFQRHRPHLQAVAYRMLGSVSESEDALQEAWLRLSRSRQETIHNARAWLTTIVGRVCIDMLRARRARREEYVGAWVPEPLVEDHEQADPEQQMLLADTVGLALLVVLETLTPTERVAYVLHDMFAVPFTEIGQIINRSPDATRQLASRARRRVHGAVPQPDADLAGQREVVDAFLAASREGDFEALVALLDPDVVLRQDFGRGVRREVRGVEAVAGQAEMYSRVGLTVRQALVNGAVGVVAMRDERPFSVGGITVREGRIVAMDWLADPERLAQIDLTILDA